MKKEYRWEKNPLEKQLYEDFEQEFDSFNMSRLVFGTIDGIHPKEHLTEKEEQIVKNTIQWLGSLTGQGFLLQNGFKRNNMKAHLENLKPQDLIEFRTVAFAAYASSTSKLGLVELGVIDSNFVVRVKRETKYKTLIAGQAIEYFKECLK